MSTPLKYKVKSKGPGKKFEYHANFANQTDAVNYAFELSKARCCLPDICCYAFNISDKVYAKFCQGNLINIRKQLGRLT